MVIDGITIPEWERQVKFNPELAASRIQHNDTWIFLRNQDGNALRSPAPQPSFESVLDSGVDFDMFLLPLRNPDNFVAGGLHKCYEEWGKVLDNLTSSELPTEDIRSWIKDGVDVSKFFRHFTGNFKGNAYNSQAPPQMYLPNAANCRDFTGFIASELEKKIADGAITLLGRVGECELPTIIMPLTIEPSKPRMCHDERFLNLWVTDNSFRLETLKDIHRLVGKDAKMISCDDKSGYHHIKLSEASRTYFGIQFGGWVMVYNTLPFGWKASPYVYQTVGMVATTYLRSYGISTTQYIDDRFGVESAHAGTGHVNCSIEKVRYALLELLTRLGYTFAIIKSILDPTTSLKHLGFIIDSSRQAYLLPVDKRNSFRELRQHILAQNEIDVKTLQRFVGKCISMVLVVPAAKLYTREVNRAIALGLKNSRKVKMYPQLLEEIRHWEFLDLWKGCMPWRTERHRQIVFATDASLYKYGVSVISGTGSGLVFSDFWENNDDRPIHLKEADALFKALQSMTPELINSRLDVLTDSTPLIYAWHNQGARDMNLTAIIKRIFQIVYEFNIDLNLQYIPSRENPADNPSRVLRIEDKMLSYITWCRVQEAFGPHTIDLMTLDSNVMKDEYGQPLRHFTPTPTPESVGVNLFAQDIRYEVNPYVFPPSSMILPVIKFLIESGVEWCTFVISLVSAAPIWMPIVKVYVVSSLCLGRVGQKGVLMMPTKKGFVLDDQGLTYPLFVYRLRFR
jgi:hypothetical protein